MPNGQTFQWVNPKDFSMKGLTFETISHDQFGGTNLARVKVDEVITVMNPDVITASGKVWTDSMNIVKEAVLEGAAKGATGGVK